MCDSVASLAEILNQIVPDLEVSGKTSGEYLVVLNKGHEDGKNVLVETLAEAAGLIESHGVADIAYEIYAMSLLRERVPPPGARLYPALKIESIFGAGRRWNRPQGMGLDEILRDGVRTMCGMLLDPEDFEKTEISISREDDRRNVVVRTTAAGYPVLIGKGGYHVKGLRSIVGTCARRFRSTASFDIAEPESTI